MDNKEGAKNWGTVCFCLASAFVLYLYLIFVHVDVVKNVDILQVENDELMQENHELNLRIIYLEDKLEILKRSAKN